MDFEIRSAIMCHAITGLPKGHPWQQYFTLWVARRKMEKDQWYITDSMPGTSSYPRYLCRDGRWRHGVVDYEKKFGWLDDQLWTDEDRDQYHKLLDQFNEDRSFTEEATALAFAAQYAPLMNFNRGRYTFQDALALPREEWDSE